MTLTLGNKTISRYSRPFIIAEIGINHGGSLGVAKQMAALALDAGADCIKHQTHFVDDEMTEEAKTIYPPNAYESIWDVIASCALSMAEELELKSFVEEKGGIYLSTPFSRKAADFLNDINVAGFKIGSGECNNTPLVRHIASFGKPIIMSTGMNTIESIKESVASISNQVEQYALLECTNLYPSPPANVSLHGISELREAFPEAEIGFSDHSIGPTMAIASIALGATIIERHFTDTRYRKGPDIVCSMDPVELHQIRQLADEVHCALLNKKFRSKEEDAVYKFARGSIVADSSLPQGTIITEKDIWARRPGTGEIPASDFDKVVGMQLLRELKRNEQISWSDLQTPS